MSCTFNCNQGRACTCGLNHWNGGMSVDHGWQSNHTDADEDDFLKQQTVFDGMWIVGRWVLLVFALGCAAMAVSRWL
jgi:hypothetical protein